MDNRMIPINSNISRRKIFISSYLSNTLEMYDFIIAGMLIPHISHLYFPLHDEFSVLMAGSLTFMVGFIMRPVGALFFGHLGDTHGRKKALLASIFGMAGATLLIGVLPTYDTISFYAPTLMVFLRAVQGFCLGGEGQGANVFVLEHYKGQKPGYTGALLATSNGMAAVVGFFISMIVTSAYAPEGSWRFCYIFGSLLAFVGLYLRKQIPDTPISQQIKKSKEHVVPLVILLKERKLNILGVILAVGVGVSLTYTGFTFVNLFLYKFLHFPSQISLTFAMISTIIGMSLVPIAGKLCDKVGILQFIKWNAFIIALGIVPMHYLLSTGNYISVSCALLLLGLLTAGTVAAMPHFVASSFSAKDRYSGAAFSNNLAQALLGGVQPFMALYLIQETKILWSPGFYTCSIACLLWIFMYFNENKLSRFDYV